MWNGYIGTQIKRANKHLLVMNSIMVIILLVILACTGRYLYNVFSGPKPMAVSDIAAIKDAGGLSRYYVSVSGVDATDTGLQAVEKKVNKYTHEVESETRSATYFAVRAGDKMLLVKSPSNVAVKDYEGGLKAVDADVRAWFDNELRPRGKSYDDVFLPFVLDASPFTLDAQAELIICIPLLLFGFYNIMKARKRNGNFHASPIAKTLGKFGPAEQVAMSIDGELAQYGDLSPLRGTTLTVSWLIRESYFGLKIIPLSTVLWVYQKVTKRRTNGIHTGTSYGVVFCGADGKRLECGGKQASVVKMLEQSGTVVPWAMKGDSAELNTMFTKRRAEMAAGVEQRRQEFYRARQFQQGQAGGR